MIFEVAHLCESQQRHTHCSHNGTSSFSQKAHLVVILMQFLGAWMRLWRFTKCIINCTGGGQWKHQLRPDVQPAASTNSVSHNTTQTQETVFQFQQIAESAFSSHVSPHVLHTKSCGESFSNLPKALRITFFHSCTHKNCLNCGCCSPFSLSWSLWR